MAQPAIAALTPQIEFFGVTVTEPMTMLTDYLIAFASCWFAVQLIFSSRNRQYLCRRAWGLSFLLIGVGAILGGTSHGLAKYLNDDAMSAIWTATLASVGPSMALAVAGTVMSSVSKHNLRRVLHSLNVFGLLTYAIWIVSHDSFLSVIIVTVVSLGTVALLQAWALVTQKPDSAKWLIAGVFISFSSAAIQRSGIDLHVHFNHNDLYHTVQLLGLYLLYRGASLLELQEISRPA